MVTSEVRYVNVLPIMQKLEASMQARVIHIMLRKTSLLHLSHTHLGLGQVLIGIHLLLCLQQQVSSTTGQRMTYLGGKDND
jgi:hypothetical protein